MRILISLWPILTIRNLIFRNYPICNGMWFFVICNYVLSFFKLFTILLNFQLFFCDHDATTKLSKVSSARDELVRWSRRDLQAWAAHHLPPRPHVVRAKHHHQWGGSLVPPREDRFNRWPQGSSDWRLAPYVLCRPGHLPGLYDYTPTVAHLHRSCNGKKSGRCQGRRCREALRWWQEVSLQWLALDRHGLGDVRQLCPRDAHHDPQNCHSSHW